MFENKKVNGDTYYTRFIASWINSGGTIPGATGPITDFTDWLKSLGLEKEDINGIVFLATNGKLELETNAKEFLSKCKK